MGLVKFLKLHALWLFPLQRIAYVELQNMNHRPDIYKYIIEKFKLFIIVVNISLGHHYIVDRNDCRQDLVEHDTNEYRENAAISP